MLFFKNIYVFAFTQPFAWTIEQMTDALSECQFTPCGATELSHFGWTKALGKHSNNLVHQANGNILICARREEKLIPAPIIKDMVDAKCDLHFEEEGFYATKKIKEQFREDVIFELLPRAFPRITDTHAYINVLENTIVVNTSSRGKAEDLLALLRKSLGTLPVTSPAPDTSPDEVMTDWLVENSLQEPFKFGECVQLNALGQHGAVANIKNMDMQSEEVKNHLDADMHVTKLSLEFDDIMSFTLCDDLSINQIKFFDIIREQNDDINDHEDALARIDADFALMSGELNRMITSMMDMFSINLFSYMEY